MDEYFLGMIQPFAFNFAPRGWTLCSGQLLPIASYQALFSLLGTTYGGDGRTSFGIPDLRGRSIVHVGTGAGLSTISWGERGGKELTTLSSAELPPHKHALTSTHAGIDTEIYSIANDDETSETGDKEAGLGTSGSMPSIYRESPTTTSVLGGVATTISGSTMSQGGGQSFVNQEPFLGIYFSIALTGLYPSRN